jgi:hypothetical protein
MNRRSLMAGTSALVVGTHSASTVGAEGTPTAKDNRATVTRFVTEIVGAKNYAIAAEIISPDYQPRDPTSLPGLDALITRLQDFDRSNQSRWESYTMVLDDVMADRDTGAARASLTIVASGRQGTAPVLFWFAFDQDGLIQTIWQLADEQALNEALYG